MKCSGMVSASVPSQSKINPANGSCCLKSVMRVEDAVVEFAGARFDPKV